MFFSSAAIIRRLRSYAATEPKMLSSWGVTLQRQLHSCTSYLCSQGLQYSLSNLPKSSHQCFDSWHWVQCCWFPDFAPASRWKASLWFVVVLNSLTPLFTSFSFSFKYAVDVCNSQYWHLVCLLSPACVSVVVGLVASVTTQHISFRVSEAIVSYFSLGFPLSSDHFFPRSLQFASTTGLRGWLVLLRYSSPLV